MNFFTKNPNLKKNFFFCLGGGARISVVVFLNKNPNLKSRRNFF